MNKNNSHLALASLAIFILISSICILYNSLRIPRYDDILCQSNFTKNSVNNTDLFFTGNITLKLSTLMKGEIDISGNVIHDKSAENTEFVYRTVYFDYQRESRDILFLSNVRIDRHPADTIDDSFFSENIIDIHNGQYKTIRITRFKNSYVLGTIAIPQAICVTKIPTSG